MGIIPKVTCRNCQQEYSALQIKCPHCGTRRIGVPHRSPSSTDSASQGSRAFLRLNEANRWQFIFGLVLLCAVVLAVVVLIAVSIKGGGEEAARPNTPDTTQQTQVTQETEEKTAAPTADDGRTGGKTSPSVEESDEPSEETQTPDTSSNAVTSVSICYVNQERTEFAASIGDQVPLNAVIYPTDADADVEWSSSNENVAAISSNGKNCTVTATGSGSCEITVTCGGVSATCRVLVW